MFYCHNCHFFIKQFSQIGFRTKQILRPLICVPRAFAPSAPRIYATAYNTNKIFPSDSTLKQASCM